MRPAVLVVDDNPDDRLSLSDLLAARGYDVREAGDAAAGLAIARESPPDLVILDVEMPGDDGYALCRSLRADARTETVPVLMLTCHGFADEKVEGLRAGADDYVVKPCDNEELLARIDVLFRRFPPRSHFLGRLEAAQRGIEAVEHFRTFVAVLNIDVQGSSAAPKDTAAEYRRVLALNEYRSGVEACVLARGGTEVSWAGDGGTSEFADAAAAFSAAVDILARRAVGGRNGALDLRIGIAAGWELIEPGAPVGTRTSQTHNRAGHFQKSAAPNRLTVGREIAEAMDGAGTFLPRAPIAEEIVFEFDPAPG
jgi:DNA-binding response OmpR family regulator